MAYDNYAFDGKVVTREGKTVAVLDDAGTLAYNPGCRKYRNMVERFLKREKVAFARPAPKGLLPPVADDLDEDDPLPPVVPQSPPEANAAPPAPTAIAPTQDLPELQQVDRDFGLPRGTKLEVDPKERVFQGHASTLYFQKGASAYKIALDYVPTPEQILAEIERFRP